MIFPDTVYLVFIPPFREPVDIDLTLEGAKEMALGHAHLTTFDTCWAVNNNGNLAWYSKDGETVFATIVECRVSDWHEVIQREVID